MYLIPLYLVDTEMNDKQPPRDLRLTWTRLRRSRVWRWLRRMLVGALVVLLILDAVGVLLTAFPAAIEWEQVSTTGFPAGPPHQVRALALGPGGESLFAGTYGDGGVYRSDDGGDSWRAASAGLTNTRVLSLAPGPDGQSMFAGTWDGVFRSDDGGDSWRAANTGLKDMHVLSLASGPDGQSMFAGTDGHGVFRSNDGGDSWQLIPYLASGDIPTNTAWENTRMDAASGETCLNHPRVDWRYCTTYRYRAPQAVVVHGNHARLYASAGAGMILWDEIPLILWRAPTPYLILVRKTWQGIDWAVSNPLPLSVGLGLAVLALLAGRGALKSRESR
jgi:hypothetical protein